MCGIMRSRKCESKQVQFQGVFWKNCKKALQIYRKFEISYLSQSRNWKKTSGNWGLANKCSYHKHKCVCKSSINFPTVCVGKYNGKLNAHLQKEPVLYILQGEHITSYNFLINSLCTCYGICTSSWKFAICKTPFKSARSFCCQNVYNSVISYLDTNNTELTIWGSV